MQYGLEEKYSWDLTSTIRLYDNEISISRRLHGSILITCASGGGGLVRGHRVARPGRTATVWARQYPDGGRSRAPRVDVPNRASRNHPYPCTRATAAASSRGRRCAQKNVLTTRIVQDLRRGKLPSAGDYGDHRRAGQFLYLPRIHPCFVRRAEEGHDPPRKLQPPPTHQHRPRMYMSVEPTVPRGLAMAEARPVGRQNAVVAVTRRLSGSVRINVAEAESRILGGVAHRTHAPRCNTVCVRGLQQPLCAYG